MAHRWSASDYPLGDVRRGAKPLVRADLNSDPSQRATHLVNKARRVRSDPQDEIAPFLMAQPSSALLPEKEYERLDDLISAVFNVEMKRLQAHGIDTSTLLQAQFKDLLPKSLDHKNIWKNMMNRPIQTDPAMVSQALSLKPATPDSKPLHEVSRIESRLSKKIDDLHPQELFAELRLPAVPYTAPIKYSKHTGAPEPAKKAPEVQNFYIRTFTIKVKDLRRVLNELASDGYDVEQINTWLADTEDLPLYSKVHLRYCGQTKNTPWSRHGADIYSSDETKFLTRFFRRVAKVDPQVLGNATVHSVVGLTSPLLSKLPDKYADLAEMALIALFGSGTLNLEAGGKDTMVLTEVDHSTFLALGPTNLASQLEVELEDAPEKVQNRVRKYIKKVREYVDQNDSTTGDHEFNESTEMTLLKQAMPATLRSREGIAALVTVASDFGELESNRLMPFYTDLTGHDTKFDSKFTRKLADLHRLPFVDLFAWFTKDPRDYSAAWELLHQYLSNVKPLIVLALGEMQTFAMTTPLAGFSKGTFDSSRRGRHSVEENLGVPILASFDGSPNITAKNAILIVPSFHTGYLKKLMGTRKKLAQRLQDLTLDRLAICNSVKTGIDTLLQEKAFGKAFMKAKRDFIQIQTAFREARKEREQAEDLDLVPTNLLPRIVEHIRQGRKHAAVTLASAVGGFEVTFHVETLSGVPTPHNRPIYLQWIDGNDGQTWKIGPIMLPTEVAPKNKKDQDKRHIYFTRNGIDIRKADGESMGKPKAVTSGNHRTETVSIASIVLSMIPRLALPNKAGDIDLAAGSEKETSIYHSIAIFCAQPKWKHHPHLLTFKALVNVVEQGQDERQIGMNYFVFALDLPRKDFKKGGKNLKYTTPTGEKKESKLAYHTVGRESRDGVACDFDEEDVIRDELVGDDQDDEIVDPTGGESSKAHMVPKAAKVPIVTISSDVDDRPEPPAYKPLKTNVTKKASGASHTRFIDVSSDEDEEDEVARPSRKLKSKAGIKGKAVARLPTDSDDDAVSAPASRPIANATGPSKKNKGSVAPAPFASSSSTTALSKKRKKEDDNSEGRGGTKVARTMTHGGRKDK
ncbi:hypothetical protein E8E11_001926 [Didymella keratinophila]|nr:hypothetical protein E8E11_001926 [Didymella keratinophila]